MKSQKEQLDDIYQQSITELEPYWNASREDGDETHIVDQIVDHYSDDLAKIGLTEEQTIDLLTEWVFNGIT